MNRNILGASIKFTKWLMTSKQNVNMLLSKYNKYNTGAKVKPMTFHHCSLGSIPGIDTLDSLWLPVWTCAYSLVSSCKETSEMPQSVLATEIFGKFNPF